MPTAKQDLTLPSIFMENDFSYSGIDTYGHENNGRWDGVPEYADSTPLGSIPSMPTYGAQADKNVQQLMNVLGSALGQSGGDVAIAALQDPKVQAAMEQISKQVQRDAKTSVLDILQENWPWFMLGGTILIAGNIVSIWALMAAFFAGRD